MRYSIFDYLKDNTLNVYGEFTRWDKFMQSMLWKLWGFFFIFFFVMSLLLQLPFTNFLVGYVIAFILEYLRVRRWKQIEYEEKKGKRKVY